MTIISLKFLLFLAVTLAIYYIVPGKAQWLVLFAASVAFYIYAGPYYILFAAALITVSYFAARAISGMHEKQRAQSQHLEKAEKKQCAAFWTCKKRKVLAAALTAVVGSLVFLKTYRIIISGLNAFIGLFGTWRFKPASIIFPLGFSFYSFQIVAYLVDVYRGKCEAQKNFVKYALFVLFFPQITEGPIARYDRLAPQLYEPHKADYKNLKSGAQLMLWGFFKKLVIADRLGLFVNSVFADLNKYSGLVLVVTLSFYSIQMYADFSGCIDIVTGAAEMFDITLDKNFNHPYFSKTVPEYWRRWHMSLSGWFRDYVFYPVSASKLSLKLNKFARRRFGGTVSRAVAASFPVIIVWLLTGFWHGAQLNYIVWGLYYGVIIIAGIIFAPYGRKLTAAMHINTDSFLWRLFQMLRTFAICTFARIFFRAKDFSESVLIISKMFGGWPSSVNFFSLGLDRFDFTVAVLSVLLLLAVSILQEKSCVRERIARQNVFVRWAVYYAALFAVIIYGVYGSSNTGTAFIYEKF